MFRLAPHNNRRNRRRSRQLLAIAENADYSENPKLWPDGCEFEREMLFRACMGQQVDDEGE